MATRVTSFLFVLASLLALLCGSMRAQVPHMSSGGMATDGGCAQGTRSIGDASTILDEPAHLYPNNHDFYAWSIGETSRSAALGIRLGDEQITGGNVSLTGELILVAGTTILPAMTSHGTGVSLVYRSHTTETAAVDLHANWHIDAVDKVTVSFDGEDLPDGIEWLTGTGDKFQYGAFTTPTPLSGYEAWFTSSAAFSRFRIYCLNLAEPEWILERYWPDGRAMRYELIPGSTTVYRPSTFFDSFDNASQYAWRTSDGRIESITDARGMQIFFDWSGSTCTVKLRNTSTSSDFSGRSWSFTLSSGKVVSITQTPQAVVTSGGSAAIDVSSPTTTSRVLEFSYHGTGDGVGRISEIETSWTNGVSGSYAVLTVDYGITASKPRVTQQIDVHGRTHGFAYTGSTSLTSCTYTAPTLTTYAYTLDAYGRPTQLIVTPTSAGRPRNVDGEGDSEPATVTYAYTYSCSVCPLLATVTSPLGNVVTMTHNSENGQVTSITTPSPTGSGTVQETFDYESFDRGSRPKWHRPLGGSGGSSTAADTLITYSWTSRGSGLAGEKPTLWTVTTSTVMQHGEQTAEPETVVELDMYGRVAIVTNHIETAPGSGSGVETAYGYAGPSSTGKFLLTSVERNPGANDGTNHKVVYTIDDLGRVSGELHGAGSLTTTISITHDTFGRSTVVTSNPGSGSGTAETKTYRDKFGNVAAVLQKNQNEANSDVKFEDGSGSGRGYVRKEWHYDEDELQFSRIDRRALPLGDNPSTPTSGSDPWLVEYTFTRDSGGVLTDVEVPNGSKFLYVIDGYGTLFRVLHEHGNAAPIELARRYIDDDLRVSEIWRPIPGDFAKTTIHRNHGGDGYVTKVVGPTDVEAIATLDSMGRTTLVDVKGSGGTVRHKTAYAYNELGRRMEITRHLLDSGGTSTASVATQIYYTAQGSVAKVVDWEGRESRRVYDVVGRLVTASDAPNGGNGWNSVALTYVPGRDEVASSTANLIEEIDDATPPAGGLRSYVTEYERDAFGRVKAHHDKGHNGAETARTTTYAYDSLGNLVKAVDPMGKIQRWTYDADGRWIEDVQIEGGGGTPAKIKLSSAYTDVGANPAIERIDGAGFVTKHIYDPWYRLAEVRRPGYTSGPAHSSTFTYDGGSRVHTATDGRGTSVEYTYDEAGRVLEADVTPAGVTSSLSTREVFVYDDVGRMTEMATLFGVAEMVRVKRTHDSLGRMPEESFFFYGVDTSHPSVVTNGFVTSTGTDPDFRRKLTYPSGFELDAAPDDLGRLKSKSLKLPGAGSAATLASYRMAGGLVKQRTLSLVGGSDELDTFSTFDGYGRLSGFGHSLDGGSTMFGEHELVWDAANNLIADKYEKVDSSDGDAFAYDKFHRMTGAKLGVASWTGTYSSYSSAKAIVYGLNAGNSRTSVSESINGGSPAVTSYTTESNSPRYSAVGGDSPLYDGEGNAIFDGRLYLVYDWKNRLSEVYVLSEELPASSLEQRLTASRSSNVSATAANLRDARAAIQRNTGGEHMTQVLHSRSSLRKGSSLLSQTTASAGSGMSLTLVALYGYDPMNRRVYRYVNTSPAIDHRYVYDGWREIEQRRPVDVEEGVQTVSERVFTWGKRIDELLSYHVTDDGSTWDHYYASQGLRDDVVALHDVSGTLVEKVEYDPYGKASVYAGSNPAAEASTVGNPHLYAGRRLDDETGFYYFRNRYLHTGWGRFLTNDPIGAWGDKASLGNGLAFVGNSPAGRVDPSGMLSISGAFGGGGAIGKGDGGGDGGGWMCAPPAGGAGGGEQKSPEGPSCPATVIIIGGGGPTTTLPIGPVAAGVEQSTTLSNGISFTVQGPIAAGSTISFDTSASGITNAVISEPGPGFLSELGGIALETGAGMIPGYDAVAAAVDGDYLSAGINLGFDFFGKFLFKALEGAGRALAASARRAVGGCARVNRSCRIEVRKVEGMGNVPTAPSAPTGLADDAASGGGRMTPDQQALKEIVDEASIGGRKPLSRGDAETVLDWADEVNYPGARAKPNDVTGNHPGTKWDGKPHIHIPGAGKNGHVPVQPGVRPR